MKYDEISDGSTDRSRSMCSCLFGLLKTETSDLVEVGTKIWEGGREELHFPGPEFPISVYGTLMDVKTLMGIGCVLSWTARNCDFPKKEAAVSVLRQLAGDFSKLADAVEHMNPEDEGRN